MPRQYIVAVCLFLAVAAFASTGERPPFKSDKPPIPGVEVELRFSALTLDPLKPDKSYAECVVRNKSAKDISVPTVYSGGFADQNMVIWAKYQWELTMHKWASEKEQVRKTIKPKEELVVFKMELKELLRLDDSKEVPLKPGEKRIYWSWTA